MVNLLEIVPDGMFQTIPTVPGAIGRIIKTRGKFPLYHGSCPSVSDNRQGRYGGWVENPIVSQRITYQFFQGENPFHMFYVRCYIKQDGHIIKFGGTLEQYFNHSARKQDFYNGLMKMVCDEDVFSILDIDCNKCENGKYRLSRNLVVDCNRCSGRGFQSVSHQWKNAYYDADTRRKMRQHGYNAPEHWHPDERLQGMPVPDYISNPSEDN